MLSVVGLNVYFVNHFPDPHTRHKISTSSLSAGESYFGRFNLWQSFAQKGNWLQASQFENQLDTADTIRFQTSNQPEYLQKTHQELITKDIKDQEDWLELAKIQIKLGKTQDARISISQAYYLDPVRDDIYRLYLQLVN